ncbi:MAG: hypothetical protein A3J66_00385 [Candidatus Magasanikbacteria bacterium RIFCSPHIGHO2_02_FULL_47_14]|uniref:Uncharacterized protein n=1 Tax=Candidatus Magasanikbacteria bacterium RIFCSPHIGHO2_02_FULL_47_14 TaxID=1798680 RepID=A0A1F6MAJ0_9BACT|nr:MAG: hypothetical protein A3J66_00385 [Candidatus Magasanikbacteria bacterium RIFCSPHIGHO2_02_FULL_47_14]
MDIVAQSEAGNKDATDRIFVYTTLMFSKKSPNNFTRYTDPTGELPTGELKAGFWYIRHKLLLGRIGVGFLVAWCVLTVGYSLFGWGKYLFFDYAKDQRMLQRQVIEIPDYTVVQPLYQAQPLSLGSTDVFQGAPDRYDFFTPVTNPNERFLASVTFSYTYSGGQTATATAVLMPQVPQALVVFGEEADQYPGAARLTIHEIDWQRISPHVIPDVNAFQAERDIFIVENVTVRDAGVDEVPVPQVEFDLTNDSVYPYWEPRFVAELLQGGRVIGIQFLSVQQLRGKETRHIKFHTQSSIRGVSDVRLLPLFSIFDLGEYMSAGA